MLDRTSRGRQEARAGAELRGNRSPALTDYPEDTGFTGLDREPLEALVRKSSVI